MYKRNFLDMEEAATAVKAVIKEASKDKSQPIAVAVTDTYGELIYYAKMDESLPLFGHMAMNKAFTAAHFRQTTRYFHNTMKKWKMEVGTWDDDRIVTVAGGVCIIKPDGTFLGGIGVSGREPDEDEALAEVGIKALNF